MVSGPIVLLRRRLVNRRQDLVARCDLKFVAIEQGAQPFADSRLCDLRVLVAQ